MSIIFGMCVALFLSFLPTMMCVYYKASTGITVATVILNLFGFFTFGVTWVIAFIVAMCGIKFTETIKSILFAIMLMILCVILGVAEIGFIANLLS